LQTVVTEIAYTHRDCVHAST